jgi:hypothetical protein
LSVAAEVYRRAVDLLEADIDEELVALDPKQGNCFGFNPVAKGVWRKLEQPRTFDELRSELLAEYDVTDEECTLQLRELLDDLIVKGLVVTGRDD